MGAGPLPLRRFAGGRAGKTSVRPLLHQKSITDARRSHPARNGAHCALRAFLALKRRCCSEEYMNISKLMSHMGRFGLAGALIVSTCAIQRPQVFAQTPAPAAGGASEADQLFKGIYLEFYNTYRLGPADEIAIRVTGQPDYTLERVKVSPTGSVYHPLLGDVDVAGMTVPRLTKRLTADLSEYLIDP